MMTPEREREIRSGEFEGDTEEFLALIDALRAERDELKAKYEFVREKAAYLDRPTNWDAAKANELFYKTREENEALRAQWQARGDRIQKLRGALQGWLASCPTDKDGRYCSVNQWQETNALEVLRRDDRDAEGERG